MPEQILGFIERLLRLAGAALFVSAIVLAVIPLRVDTLGVSYSCGGFWNGGALSIWWSRGSDPLCSSAAVGRMQVALGLAIGGIVLALGARRLIAYLAGTGER